MASRSRSALVSVLLVVGAAIVPNAAGCRQIAGIDHREATTCGAAAEKDGACDACSVLRCCDELTACAADPVCARAQACLAACAREDGACRLACTTQHLSAAARTPGGSEETDAALASVLACQTTACGAECRTSCGAVPEAPTCATCNDRACCTQARACSADAACLTRRLQRARAHDDGARDLSDRHLPGGRSLDEAVEACHHDRCPGACGAWACLGSAPELPSGPIRVTLQVGDADIDHPAPVDGLVVDMCERGALDCDRPVATRTTRGGVVVFEDIARGFDGYFQIRDPADVRLPELVFLEPRVDSDRTTQVAVFTRADRFSIVAELGIDPAPSTSLVLVRPRDCAGADADGVRLGLGTNEPVGTPFYLRNRQPTLASAEMTTDAVLAIGGFAEVPPGGRDLRATVAGASGDLFRSGIKIRSGTVTFVAYDARP